MLTVLPLSSTIVKRKWAGRNTEYKHCIAEIDCKVLSSSDEAASSSESLYSDSDASSVSNLTGPNDDWPACRWDLAFEDDFWDEALQWMELKLQRLQKSVLALFFRSKFETKTKYSLNWNFRVFWPNTPIGTYHHALWQFLAALQRNHFCSADTVVTCIYMSSAWSE